MKELQVLYIQNPEEFNLGNAQPLKEMMLRLAVQYCEFYATDVLILFDTLTEKVKLQNFDLEIGFRQFGIDWPRADHRHYRFIAKLEKRGTALTLFGEPGTV